MSYGFKQLYAWGSFLGDLELDQVYQECSSKEQLKNFLEFNSQIEGRDITDFVQLSLAPPSTLEGSFSA